MSGKSGVVGGGGRESRQGIMKLTGMGMSENGGKGVKKADGRLEK
jgi:hypothetical protein